MPNFKGVVPSEDAGTIGEGYVLSSVAGVLNEFNVVDNTTTIAAEAAAAYALGKWLRLGPGYYHLKGFDPDSGWLLEGSGEGVTFLVSDKDLPAIRTSVNAKAYAYAQKTQYTVTALRMDLSFNPLSSDNSYVSVLTITGNAASAGMKAGAQCHIHSQDVVPYTSGASKKAYMGEDFEVLRVTPNADGTTTDIYVKGRLAWHTVSGPGYSTGMYVDWMYGTRQYALRNMSVVGKKRKGEVTKAVVTAQGSGYTTPPTITPDNTGTGGTGAIFACSLQLGAAIVSAGGSGGTNGTFSFSLSGGGALKQGTGTFTVSGGALVSAIITNPGDKYTSMPTASLTASAGLTGASLTFTGYIGEIHVGTQTSPGLGQGTGHGDGNYTSPPVLNFSGGAGTGAAGAAFINGKCFDADYDVDTTQGSFHAHAIGAWYLRGFRMNNVTFDDLWEGAYEVRHCPFAETWNLTIGDMPNFKTQLSSPWQGRLGYGNNNYNSSRTRHVNTKTGKGRHPGYTDGNTETSTSTGGLKNISLDLGTSCYVQVNGVVSRGCNGTLLGPHEGCNFITFTNIDEVDGYQGDQDESYRHCVLQLRGCNITVNGLTCTGGSDAIRYQDTEQPNSVHILDNIVVRGLTDSTENSHAFRYPSSSSTYQSKIIIGDITAHRIGKVLRVDSGGNVVVEGCVTGSDIGNVFIDVQDGATLIVNKSFSDFTLANTANTSRKDYNVAGTCTLVVNDHACRLGAAKNPSNTITGTPTAATVMMGKRTIINDLAVTEPTEFPASLSGYTITPLTGKAAPYVDFQEFTGNGTWTKPWWATTNSRIRVEMCAGGGGGGGGARLAAAGTGTGGAGGGGGNMQYRDFKASDITSTVAITIGGGGSAGAGATSDGNPGSNGVAGSNTTFGAFLTAFGGGYGSGGQVAANSGGGGGGGYQAVGGNGASGTGGTGGTGGGGNGGNGAAGSSNATGSMGGCGGSGCPNASGVGITGGSGGWSPAGGSSGGGVLVGVFKAGGDGAQGVGYYSAAPAGGATAGAGGGNATALAYIPQGISGGGGAGNGAGVGGAAGNSAGYGAGGSGGGAGIAGNGGAGKAGTGGLVRVWTYA